jgi:hypothetical protein
VVIGVDVGDMRQANLKPKDEIVCFLKPNIKKPYNQQKYAANYDFILKKNHKKFGAIAV